MKTIVIYHSQTGFTKQYAQWIAEGARADCLSLSQAKSKNLNDYDAIIFGSWARASAVCKLSWFKKRIEGWKGKKLLAFCVGASPLESPEVQKALKEHFHEPKLQEIPLFYCPGGLNYEKMSLSSRVMMKLFVKVLKGKKDQTPQEREMARMISSSYDLSDKKYIQPILDCLNR